jgi:hypothetical protein
MSRWGRDPDLSGDFIIDLWAADDRQ